jgi:flagellar biosynthetic protein FliQ
MNGDQAVELARRALETALWISAPILLAAIAIGILISVLQVVTSVQDMTISTVPRLAIVGAVVFFLSPWMMRYMMGYMTRLLSDLHPYLR